MTQILSPADPAIETNPVTSNLEPRRAAAVSGAISGVILGAIQSWGMGVSGPPARQWIAATGAGSPHHTSTSQPPLTMTSAPACAPAKTRNYTASESDVKLKSRALIAGITTGMAVARDFETGFYDRFLMSPAPRNSLLAGPMLAAVVRALIPLTLLLLVAWVGGAHFRAGAIGMVARYDRPMQSSRVLDPIDLDRPIRTALPALARGAAALAPLGVGEPHVDDPVETTRPQQCSRAAAKRSPPVSATPWAPASQRYRTMESRSPGLRAWGAACSTP